MDKVYIFAILCLINFAHSLPIDTLIEDNIDNENYDVIIDQRQNGTQNFRVKISGLSIAIPDDREPSSDSATSSPSLDQLSSLLSASGSQQSVNFDDFAELAEFLQWKKSVKSGDKKISADTQSRTKDIPTTAQMAVPTDIRNLAHQENRRYKLLIGEKYILPILRFLKKQTEDVQET